MMTLMTPPRPPPECWTGVLARSLLPPAPGTQRVTMELDLHALAILLKGGTWGVQDPLPPSAVIRGVHGGARPWLVVLELEVPETVRARNGVLKPPTIVEKEDA